MAAGSFGGRVSPCQGKRGLSGPPGRLARKKAAFDAAEAERVRQLEEARLTDPSTMRALLGRRLDNLAWPSELEMENGC